MNREIKFRGLREDGKGWVYGYYFEQPMRYGHYSSIYVEDGNEEESHTGWVHVKRDTVCQFTGLKDKNGVDIYEGDVLMFANKKSAPATFDNGCFNVWDDPLGWDFDSEEKPVKFELNQTEIIGNIHENQELLK